ncbi:MAG: hypothetical protein ACM3S5_15110 [Rhodospirillales bacterium]
MTRCAKGILVVFAAAGMASAGTVSCPPPPDPGVPMNVVGLAAYCGGLTFSNFQVMPFSNDKTFRPHEGSIRPAGGWASLAFDLGAQRIQPFSDSDRDERDESRAVKQTACNSLVASSDRQADCPKSVLPAGFFTARGSSVKEDETSSQRTWPAKTDGSHSPDSEIPDGSQEPVQSSDVPEPAAFLLAGPALLALLALRRRRVQA